MRALINPGVLMIGAGLLIVVVVIFYAGRQQRPARKRKNDSGITGLADVKGWQSNIDDVPYPNTRTQLVTTIGADGEYGTRCETEDEQIERVQREFDRMIDAYTRREKAAIDKLLCDLQIWTLKTEDDRDQAINEIRYQTELNQAESDFREGMKNAE